MSDPHSLFDPSARPVDPLVGSIMADRYKIIRRLGEGGMGVVYEGEHILIKRRVAIKTLHPQFARNGEIVARFQREALAATAIGNEHIIEVTDMGRLTDGAIFLVLEFLDGRDFGNLLEAVGPLSVPHTVHIVSQICDALQAAHDKAIIHRDLKPQNIYLIRRGNEPHFVKVLDFGISKFLDSEHASSNMTRTGAALGTPYYLSPEQANGAKDIDHRTDIYSIGVILYHTLTCDFPFNADSFPALVLQIVSQPAPDVRNLRADIPAGLAEIIQRTLAKDRRERPSSCNELKRLLEPFADPTAGARPNGVYPPPPAAAAEWGILGASKPGQSHMTPSSGPSSQATPPGVAHFAWPAPAPVIATPSGSKTRVPAPSASLVGTEISGDAATVATRRWLSFGAIALTIVAGLVALRIRDRANDGTGATAVRAASSAEPAAHTPSERLNEPAPVMHEPAPQQASPIATAVRVRISTNPGGAQLRLDGLPVANPFSADLPSGREIHRVEAALVGHRSVVQEIALLFPQDITIDLRRGSGVEHRRTAALPTATHASEPIAPSNSAIANPVQPRVVAPAESVAEPQHAVPAPREVVRAPSIEPTRIAPAETTPAPAPYVPPRLINGPATQPTAAPASISVLPAPPPVHDPF